VEEISLREIIEILLKRKKTIGLITLLCVLISFVLNYFILKEQYEASTAIMVSEIDLATSEKLPSTNVILSNGQEVDLKDLMNQANKDVQKDISTMLDSMLNYKQMSIEALLANIKSPRVITNVVEKLKLDPKIYTIEKMRSIITTENEKESNVIKIKIKEKDPKLSADIANAVATELIRNITLQNNKQTKQLKQYIEQLISIEEQKIDELNKEIEALDENNPEEKAMEKRLTSKLSILSNIYEALIQKSEQLDLIDKALFGESSIIVASAASEPKEPAFPKKNLNLAISFVLGIMLAAFIAFFQEYWERTKPGKVSERNL
jgi:capsular polysaccharide biosynthesis protein